MITKSAEIDNEKRQDGDIRILIIDDNEFYCQMLEKLSKKMGMTATYETTIKKGLKAATAEAYDVILLDVNLPDGSGLDIIPLLRKGISPPEIIIITGYSDESSAETAIQNHAWDYISKNSSIQNLSLSLNRAVQYRRQKKSASPETLVKRDRIIGKSAHITQCLAQASRAAATDSPVLILGETGTGKEIFAKTIHENSPQATGDFVVVDCSALPDHLVESTLFGHKKGAFTNADSDKIGLVEQAHSGTLFLDEIGELAGEIQKKFLRVLQEKRFRPLGGKNEVESDFRLICATNRDLSEMVENRNFRQDLYYRICTIAIELPPLRQRTEDINDLVNDHVNRNAGRIGMHPRQLTTDFIEALQDYSWPGNVRELFNTIDCVFTETPQESEIFSRHLPTHIRAEVARKRIKASVRNLPDDQALDSDNGSDELIPLKELLDRTRSDYIENLIVLTEGNIAEACRISKLSRGHLYDLMKKYQIRV